MSQIEKNIWARKEAEELMRHIDEVMDSHGDAKKAFWKAIVRWVKEHPMFEVDQLKVVPYNDKEAHSFGKKTMVFGCHGGKQIDDIPLDYLEWLDEQDEKENFKDNLKRYLQSDYVRRERLHD